MQIEGRRFHIAGSAHAGTRPDLLAYAHVLIAELCDQLTLAGGAVVVGVGREPLAAPSPEHSAPVSTVFDWTVLERVAAHLSSGGSPRTAAGRIVASVVSSKTEAQIPASRRRLWDGLKAADAVSMEFLDAGWFSGAVRRQHQERLGDVLIVLSGGEGAEHLAHLYVQAGKPVIPLDLDLGNTTDDGAGGAARLYQKALAAPSQFIRVGEPSRAALLFSELRSDLGKRAAAVVVTAVMALLNEVTDPMLFCVRLLNPTVNGFAHVDHYFRNVVGPLAKELGYAIFETGHAPTEYGWMNEEIFDKLHYSSAVLVDLTGLRNNCFMELGYALGHQQKVIVTALESTDPPFDSAAIPHHFWTTTEGDTVRQSKLKEFWARNIDRPALVRQRRVL